MATGPMDADQPAALPPHRPATVLTPREQALVDLLARGYTDAIAARELAISERSITNILRSLMDRLGVDNRFQLGAALGALGVARLPPDEDTGEQSE